MNLKEIHLDHALPALADLGIETLVPLLGGQGFTEAAAARALQGLAAGADRRAVRRLVAVASASGEELLEWEDDPAKQAAALKKAALTDLAEAKETVTAFFASLGPFLAFTQGSLEPGKEAPAMPSSPAADQPLAP